MSNRYNIYNKMKGICIVKTPITHIHYAIRVLQEHGNAFISDRTRKALGDKNIIEYLQEHTGKTVTIRECKSVDYGCVAEMNIFAS